MEKIKEILAWLQREPIWFVAVVTWLATTVLENWSLILPFLVQLGIPESYQQAVIKLAGLIVALMTWWQGRKFTLPLTGNRGIVHGN